MRLSFETVSGKTSSGVRRCDRCGLEQQLRKPRRWDICAKCDMKNRYDSGRTVPPLQIKRSCYFNWCLHCRRAFQVKSRALQQGGPLEQKYCSSKCMGEAVRTAECKSCGKLIKPGKRMLCEKCNVKRWNKEEGRGWLRNKYKTDISFRLAVLIRGRVKSALRTQLRRKKLKSKRIGTLERWLGCSIEELQDHLEANFKVGMCWHNWGPRGWHIDHIFPISKTDLTTEKGMLAALNYRNLQPLWAMDNLRKHARVPRNNEGGAS